MKPTEILSRFVVETSFKDLSSEVVKKVKTSLMDTATWLVFWSVNNIRVIL
ncbi:MAG: hypothetical protein GTN80_03270 [Nitrososphaeria archaeon]|nr:hypothetical protein [Nitrososphaeria archaeon]NIQ32653.1 hypothetical protein [Nitrososphaeria archaeon]